MGSPADNVKGRLQTWHQYSELLLESISINPESFLEIQRNGLQKVSWKFKETAFNNLTTAGIQTQRKPTPDEAQLYW